jgi:peptide-methionine (S)-S-oxide reductase
MPVAPESENAMTAFTTSRRPVLLAALFVVSAGIAMQILPSAAEEGRAIPAPARAEPVPEASPAVAILSGGCFWGVQGVFLHVAGVTGAVSGYAGGGKADAEYDRVSTGTTGHAESVLITYDPHQISYGKLLQIYFSVAHDPTELNRQGPDSGSQYRSAIFPTDAAQAETAKAYIAQLDQAHIFTAPIVTRIEPGHAFFPAEAYHQDFLTRNPAYPYIRINDLPKIDNLKRLFPDLYRAEPVLVADAPASQ